MSITKRNISNIRSSIARADAEKKVNPLDLSSDQDLTIGLMNLIAIENRTNSDCEFHRQIKKIREQLMSQIIPLDSPLFEISVQTLSCAVGLIASASSLSGDDAYAEYDTAYEVYSLFWGLNMGLIDISTAKKLLSDTIKY